MNDLAQVHIYAFYAQLAMSRGHRIVSDSNIISLFIPEAQAQLKLKINDVLLNFGPVGRHVLVRGPTVFVPKVW